MRWEFNYTYFPYNFCFVRIFFLLHQSSCCLPCLPSYYVHDVTGDVKVYAFRPLKKYKINNNNNKWTQYHRNSPFFIRRIYFLSALAKDRMQSNDIL